MTGATVKTNLAPRDGGGVSQCQKSLDSDSDTPPAAETSERVSESEKKLIRILLSERVSAALTEAGEQCFAIIGKASHPDDPSRWVLHLAPVEWETAHDACEVLLGRKRATAIRKPKTTTPQ